MAEAGGAYASVFARSCATMPVSARGPQKSRRVRVPKAAGLDRRPGVLLCADGTSAGFHATQVAGGPCSFTTVYQCR